MTRYHLECAHDGDSDFIKEEADDGAWVRAEEVLALTTRLAQMTAALEKLLNAIDREGGIASWAFEVGEAQQALTTPPREAEHE